VRLVGPEQPQSLLFLRAVTFRKDGGVRPVPVIVHEAVTRLEKLEQWGTQDNPERGRLAYALKEYCEALSCIEAHYTCAPQTIAGCQEPLFRYLNSSRLFADFHAFGAELRSIPSLSPDVFCYLHNRIFGADAFGFFVNMKEKLIAQRPDPLLPVLIGLAEDTVPTVDPELLGHSLSFLAAMYALKRLDNVRFLKAAFERTDLKQGTLLRVIEVLGHCDYELNPSLEDRDILFNVGVEAVRRASSHVLEKYSNLRSEPHVEFGFRVQRILKLSQEQLSGSGLVELRKLVRGIPEYFCYGDKAKLKLNISRVREAVLSAMGNYPDFEALPLARVSRGLMREPWHGEFTALWGACSRRDTFIESAAGALILKETLRDPETVRALQSELYQRDTGEIPTPLRELRNFGLTVARLICYERSFGNDTVGSDLLEQILLLLKGSPRITQSVVPELLSIVGIAAIRTPFGAISLPWNISPDPRPLICALARDLLYDVKNTLGFVTRYRLGFRHYY